MPPVAGAKRMLSWLALIAVALIPLGCERSPGPAAAPPSDTQRQQPRQVRVVPAAEEVVDRRVSATGTLAADEQVVLGTKVAGRIGELLVDLGSRVRRDQTVARSTPPTLSSAWTRRWRRCSRRAPGSDSLGRARTTAWIPSTPPSCARRARCLTRRG